MTLLVLFPRSAPAGIVAADVLALVLDHGLDRLRRRGPVAAAVRPRRAFGHADRAGTGSNLLQRRGLRVRRAAGVVERPRRAAVAAEGAFHLRGVDFDLG